MNIERDSDLQLRAWASEGVDRAPEHFVWAALDAIEGVSQRPAWRTGLDHLVVRLRPALTTAGVAAVVLVAFAILTRAVAPIPGVGGSRPFEAEDLPGIVLWEATMPTGWTLDNLVSNPTEVARIPIRSMTATQIAAHPNPAGLIAGRYTDFSGPDGAFMSWSVLFESDVLAAAALPFYNDEMAAADAWGLGAGEPIAFGDGGLVFSGETTALVGPPTGDDPHPARLYLWRDGNLLLAMGGWFDFDPDQLRGLAEAMNSRAEAISHTR